MARKTKVDDQISRVQLQIPCKTNCETGNGETNNQSRQQGGSVRSGTCAPSSPTPREG